MKKSGRRHTIWKWTKRVFLFLLVSHLLYIVILKWVNPPITITQLVSWVSGHGMERDYVSGKEISPNAKLAVIASEDQLFIDHSGFDWKSMKKAMEFNEKQSKKRRGGSTISQQVAKNVFLWQGGGYFRKGLEAYFTFMIELIWGKERILDVYLNVAEMGKGVFGVEKAANKFFNKKASQLTRSEAALIAACLPNPKVLNAAQPSGYVSGRSRAILRQMNNLSPDPELQELIGNPVKPEPVIKKKK